MQPFYLPSGSSVLHLTGAAASPNFFDVLGAASRLGRFFQPEDGNTGAPTAMVLSYGAWRRQFGGDSSGPRWLGMPSKPDLGALLLRRLAVGLAPDAGDARLLQCMILPITAQEVVPPREARRPTVLTAVELVEREIGAPCCAVPRRHDIPIAVSEGLLWFEQCNISGR